MLMTDPISRSRIDQVCAVPYRFRRGAIEVCLITSSTGRWIFPKGVRNRGAAPEDTALEEALEEAGLHGKIVGGPLGSYEIVKNSNTLMVVALLMNVTDTDKVWQEANIRERRWVSLKKAYRLVAENELHELLDALKVRLNANDSQ